MRDGGMVMEGLGQVRRSVGGWVGLLLAAVTGATLGAAWFGLLRPQIARRRLRRIVLEELIAHDMPFNFQNWQRGDARKFLAAEDPAVCRHFDEKLVDESDSTIRERYALHLRTASQGQHHAGRNRDYGIPEHG